MDVLQIWSVPNIDVLPIAGTHDVADTIGNARWIFRNTVSVLDRMREAKLRYPTDLRISLNHARLNAALAFEKFDEMLRAGYSLYDRRGLAKAEEFIADYLADLLVAKRSWNAWIASSQQAFLGDAPIVGDPLTIDVAPPDPGAPVKSSSGWLVIGALALGAFVAMKIWKG